MRTKKIDETAANIALLAQYASKNDSEGLAHFARQFQPDFTQFLKGLYGMKPPARNQALERFVETLSLAIEWFLQAEKEGTQLANDATRRAFFLALAAAGAAAFSPGG